MAKARSQRVLRSFTPSGQSIFSASHFHIFFFVVAIFFVGFPAAAHAAVLINEIAWMGSVVSANAEWIELYNGGSTPVDLAG